MARKTTTRRKRKNGLLQRMFGTRTTVYPVRRSSSKRRRASGRATTSPRGTEVTYQGVKIRKTPDGDYATSIDWDNRHDSLTDAKHFVKSWQQGVSNPSIFDFETATRAGRERRAELERNLGAIHVKTISLSEIIKQFEIWWKYNRVEVPENEKHNRRGNQAAYIRGFKTRRNPSSDIRTVVTSSAFRSASPITRAALITLAKGVAAHRS